ncbi:MAG TPA: phage/plasmid primase, P4 family [Rhizomicrobium sp.]|jgi:putative DNA primase/helicase|nr:phage/plasmid primase, P4 family [Rhizomicrobium sp.]
MFENEITTADRFGGGAGVFNPLGGDRSENSRDVSATQYGPQQDTEIVLGLMMREDWGAVAAAEFIAIDGESVPFADPLQNRIKLAICGLRRRGHATTVAAVRERLRGDLELARLSEYLEAMRDAAPATISDDDVRWQVRRALTGARSLQAATAESPEFSDDSLALKFAKKHECNLRYVAEWGIWMRWNGCRWIEEKTLAAFDDARAICREAAEIASCLNGEPKKAVSIASKQTVAAVESLARSDRRLAVKSDQWDGDPLLLNTPGGSVNLKTGKLRAHRIADYTTKITAVSPRGECPMFFSFLDRITNGNRELQAFFARVFGYALTGLTREHALFFFYGTGANGKSVLLETVSGILGGYAQSAPMETFAASKFDRHPTELADLQGARLVTASETEEGRALAESRIKMMTGGDRIKARKMRQDFFEFTPQFKLVMAGNHKPCLRVVDEAIKRRVNLIPFTVTIPREERDQGLTEKLRAEWPGILQWMIDGSLEWQRVGLAAPAVVTDATAEYLENEDTLNAWMAERCQIGPDSRQRSSELYASFKHFAVEAGEEPGTNKDFSARLEVRGFERRRVAIGTVFCGISLLPHMTGAF